ncbi:MAG: trypsin-like peptidase domain-containing protein [Planctomycetes bacterium]|nr:trypsin-like peptidase domain-containing protein [Planctomycetota bacterium]
MRIGARTFLLAALVMAATFTEPARAQDQSRNRRRTPVVEVFENARDAVVNIATTRVVKVRSPFGFGSRWDELFQAPRTRSRRVTSVGSGFIIHPAGYVVTNAHVVAQTRDIKITSPLHHDVPAEVIAVDADHDLAVLKMQNVSQQPFLTLGRSHDIMVGETVVSIGNPFGLQHSVTAGIISALGRDIKLGQDFIYRNLIQTDAAINPGNSGGPLLNINSELIGVTTAIRSDAQNIGFAIPINTLKRLLPVMIREQQKNQFSLGLSVDHHRRVTRVLKDSPASRAGVRVGDTVTAVNSKRVESDFDFYMQLLGHRPGQVVSLETLRSGSRRIARIRLQEPPRPDGAKLASEMLGMTLSPLSPQDARRLRLRSNAGLMIDRVQSSGPAHREGIAAGDILTRLGRYGVSDLDHIGLILDEAQAGDQIHVRILRLEQGKLYLYYTYVTLR